MVHISHRGAAMPASPIRKLAPYADAAKARGIHVYHLNIGQPDIETPDVFFEGVRGYRSPVLAYGPSNGLPQYRQALVRYYAAWNIDVTPDDIFVTTAGSEALMFSMMAITDPGDELMVLEPFYTNYNGFAAMMGVRLIGVPTSSDDGFAMPPLSAFESRLTKHTRGILLCNPNNPTGAVYAVEAMERLAEFARSRDLFVISDEVYREFTYGERRHVSVMELPLGDLAVMVDSVSKRYSVCGARIGCIVTRNREVLDAVLKMGQARLCPPTLEQMGAMAAVDVPESYMHRVIEAYRQRRDVLYEHLIAIPGVRCRRPEGAFYLMVSLPVNDADDFARFMLESFHLNGKTVMVAPGSGFYATPGLGRNQVRLAYVLKKDDLCDAVDILRAGLEAYAAC